MQKVKWINERPIIPGYYWFFGWPTDKMRCEGMTPELYIIEHTREADKGDDDVWHSIPWYISSHYEFKKGEGWIGLWSKNSIPLPVPPTIHQLLEYVAIVGTRS